MNFKETADKVKTHIKNHKKAYIIGAAVVGTLTTVVITKKVTAARVAAKEVASMVPVQLGDLDIPLKATKEQVLAYNRVIRELERSIPNAVDGVVPLDVAKADARVWAAIASAADAWREAQGQPILEFLNTMQLKAVA